MAIRTPELQQIDNRVLRAGAFLAETHMVKPMPEAHWHDHIELNVVVHGGMTYLISGNQIRLHEGTVYCFWAAVPHQVIDAEKDTSLVCVYVPFADFLSLVVSDAFKNDLMAGHILMAASEDAADTPTALRWATQWGTASPPVADLLRDEVRLRIRRLAVNGRRADANAASTGGSPQRNAAQVADRRVITRVQQMTAFINNAFAEPINVADVARVGGLHPTNATATFRKVLGRSIAQYLRQRRLNHALKLLADTEMSIIEVAFESGHGSLSRFYAAFQRQVGCTPKDYRRRFRA